MKVKELINLLKNYPEDMRVYIFDHIEGNNYQLNNAFIDHISYDACKPKEQQEIYDVLYLK